MKLFISEKTTGHLNLYFPFANQDDIFIVYDNKPLQQLLLKNYRFFTVDSKKNIKAQLNNLLSDLMPNIIYISGGKLGFFAGLIAKKLRIKFIIIEPNILPGLSNYTLAIWAEKIFIYNSITQIFFPPATLFIPKRIQINYKIIPKSLLVVGGSNGSLKLINFIKNNIEHLDFEKIWLITGTKNTYFASNEKLEVLSYTDDIHQYYQKAEVIISSAGANTISELRQYKKKKIILVPIEKSKFNHQYLNSIYAEFAYTIKNSSDLLFLLKKNIKRKNSIKINQIIYPDRKKKNFKMIFWLPIRYVSYKFVNWFKIPENFLLKKKFPLSVYMFLITQSKNLF